MRAVRAAATLGGVTDIAYHPMPDGQRIAFRHTPGRGPMLVFLPGYRSDMAGGKATALFDQAAAAGRGCLLFDYSGCGRSDGVFADGTLARWRDEALALIADRCDGPVVLAGSSMGGWLMLLVGQALGRQLAGLIGIAAAPDFTDWGYDAGQRACLEAGQTVVEDNPYGTEPTPTHPTFWADGQALRMLDAPIAIDCPVRLLHGLDDTAVPPAISLRLAERLTTPDLQATFIKGGTHRLSRPQDIALLLAAAQELTS